MLCTVKLAANFLTIPPQAFGEAASCILLPAADALVPLLAVHPLWATRCLAAIFQVGPWKDGMPIEMNLAMI